MSRRLYRVLLYFYPSAFRARFGRDMEATFADDLADAKNRGRVAVTGLWARALAQAILLGAEARFAALLKTSRDHPSYMSTFLKDLRFAARTFTRRPSLPIIAVLTMALGIVRIDLQGSDSRTLTCFSNHLA